jgi:hypothetical protein
MRQTFSCLKAAIVCRFAEKTAIENINSHKIVKKA